jgi:hypothetical protein
MIAWRAAGPGEPGPGGVRSAYFAGGVVGAGDLAGGGAGVAGDLAGGVVLVAGGEAGDCAVCCVASPFHKKISPNTTTTAIASVTQPHTGMNPLSLVTGRRGSGPRVSAMMSS